MSRSKEPTPTSKSPAATDSALRTSIVLPVYNERENLPLLLDELRSVITSSEMAQYRPCEIIIVGGNSTDGTTELVRQEATSHDRVQAVFLRRAYGQSAALSAGFDVATGEYVVPMDADLQNDPQDIPMLLEGLQAGADCVSGWRRDRNDPWHKTIPSRIQTHLAKLTGPDINDFGCTLTAYRREALDEISLYGEGHRYIPAKLHNLGYTVDERVVNHRPREHGESRYGIGRLARGFVDLIFHIFWVRYSSRPLHLFGSAGLLTFGTGVALGLFLLVTNYVGNAALTPRLPELVLSVALTMFGLGLFSLGVISEMLTNLIYRDDREYRIEQIYD